MARRAAAGDDAEEDGEAPHLAMCYDTDGNEFMLIRKR